MPKWKRIYLQNNLLSQATEKIVWATNRYHYLYGYKVKKTKHFFTITCAKNLTEKISNNFDGYANDLYVPSFR